MPGGDGTGPAGLRPMTGRAGGLTWDGKQGVTEVSVNAIAVPEIWKTGARSRERKIEVIGVIPNDPVVFEACLEGHALNRGEAFQAAGKILDYLLWQN